MRLSTTAEPRPTVAMANAASEPGTPALTQQAVAHRGPGRGSAGHEVGHRLHRELDAQQGEELDGSVAAVARQRRHREARVRGEGGQLHGDRGDQQPPGDVRQRLGGLAGAGELGQHQVVEDDQGQQQQDAPADAPGGTLTGGATVGLLVGGVEGRRGSRRRPVLGFGRSDHAVVPGAGGVAGFVVHALRPRTTVGRGIVRRHPTSLPAALIDGDMALAPPGRSESGCNTRPVAFRP